MTELSTFRPSARTSQTTSVEQTRAASEVAASFAIAQTHPRDVARSIEAMRAACSQRVVAERAFYSYQRGGENITGANVHLARELARCWGNVSYGFTELAVDHDAGMSELVAFAIDLETNVRNSIGVQVPHVRHTKTGRRTLTDPRDVYENNANNASRRLRTAILNTLPSWFVAEAEELCRRTLAGGANAKPLAARAADAVAHYGELGVTREQLEERLGRPVPRWTEPDLVHLIALWRQIRDGETRTEEAFPTRVVTAADLAVAPAVVVEDPPAGEDYDPTVEPGFGEQ